MPHIARSCTILQNYAPSCNIIHYLASSDTLLLNLTLYGTIQHIPALSCAYTDHLAQPCSIRYYRASLFTIWQHLHNIPPSGLILRHIASHGTIAYRPVPSCTFLHHLAPSGTILHLLVPSCATSRLPAKFLSPLGNIRRLSATSSAILNQLAQSLTITYHTASCNSTLRNLSRCCIILHHLALF